MPRTKKFTLTQEQAEELESLLSDYLSVEGFGDPMRDITDFCRQTGIPRDVTASIKGRLESLAEDLQTLQENMERMLIDAMSEDLKNLDAFLEKRFKVETTRKRPYKWEVSF